MGETGEGLQLRKCSFRQVPGEYRDENSGDRYTVEPVEQAGKTRERRQHELTHENRKHYDLEFF